MKKTDETITLIGAGLAGSLLAIFLARRGFKVEVYERRPDMRTTEISAGRSINMAMSARGIHALEQVGLKDEIMKLAIPMPGRMIHPIEGELGFQPYGQRPHEVIYSVSRGELNKSLMTAAERHPGVRLHFQERCEHMDLRSGEVHIRHSVTGKDRTITPQRVIATDGSGSAIRMSMLGMGRFNFAQEFLDHGYKELEIPPGEQGTFMLEPHALHIWPRGVYMLIALPNPDGSFTCTLFFPFDGEYSFASLSTPDRVSRFFKTQFPDVVQLMPDLESLFFSNPTGTMVTVKCFPWHHEDRALLLGDAAHAIVPFFGQGMNCAFEDCTVLGECIDQDWPDWERVFHAFGQQRKEHTDAIADMAVDNYIEMRDRVADPAFLLQKKVGLSLEQRYPEVFIPKYSMVSFHRLPYAEAMRRGQTQESILRELSSSISSIDEVNWEIADKLVRERLT